MELKGLNYKSSPPANTVLQVCKKFLHAAITVFIFGAYTVHDY